MNKVAFITGVSGGIGSCVAQKFINYGFKVIGIDKDEPEVDFGDQFVFYSCDLSEIGLRTKENLIGQLGEGLSKLILINNAAFQHVSLFEDISSYDWKKTFDVNFFSAIELIKLLTPHLSSSSGSIVNISSIHSRLTKKSFSAYAASKAAMESITKSLAIEFGSKGIRINAVSPAAIKTQMLLDGFEGKQDLYAQLKSHHPNNDIGSPERLADLVFQVAVSDDLFWSGSVLNYDGGISAVLSDPDNLFGETGA